MDILSIVGITLAAVAILGGQWLEGGNLGSLVQGAAFLIVLGGTLAAVHAADARCRRSLRACGLRKLDGAAAAVRSAGHHRATGRMVGRCAPRRHAVAGKSRSRRAMTPSRGNGLQMLVDGFEPERIREAIEIEIVAWEDRTRAAAKVWEAAGGYAPTIGILGAVLGLIHVMENLSDPTKLGQRHRRRVRRDDLRRRIGEPAVPADREQAAHAHHRGDVPPRARARRPAGIANGENPKLIGVAPDGLSRMKPKMRYPRRAGGAGTRKSTRTTSGGSSRMRISSRCCSRSSS